MTTNDNSKSAIMKNTILGKIASVIGWIVTLFILPITIVGIASPNEAGKGLALVFCFIILGIGIWLITFGVKTKKIIKRFKQYVSIIAGHGDNSIENIASAASQSIDFVMRDIDIMIKKKYFMDASIDFASKELVFKNRVVHSDSEVKPVDSKPLEYVKVNCQGCGATNKIVKGKGGDCEFCGSPLV